MAEQHGADSPGSTACLKPPPQTSPCRIWEPGAAQVIASPPPPNAAIYLAGVLPTECGALTAWYENDDPAHKGTISWSTRVVGFDGAATAPPVPHPGLSATTNAAASLSLAMGSSGIGALEDDETGCHFLELDRGGHDQGAPIALGAPGCIAIAAVGSRWSFLRAGVGGVTPATLDLLDPGTGHETLTVLGVPSGQVLWDRLVFDDGSFLVDTFREEAKYTDWLEPFAPDGAAAGPQIPVAGFDSAPVWLASAGSGAVAAWTWGALHVLPVDRHGAPAGLERAVVTGQTIYGMVVLPAPDGDVLLAWMSLEAGSHFSTYVQALAPDGTARGPATQLETNVDNSRIYGAVAPDGTRALLARQRQDGIVALPLSCGH